MKILQVIPTLDMGGAETMCQGLSIQLHRMGHQISVVCLSGDRTVLTRRLESQGIPVFHLDKALGMGLDCIPKLRHVLDEVQPQVIHTHLHSLKYVALAMGRRSIPILHTIHNQADQEAVFLDKQISRWLFRRGKATPVALSREIQNSIVSLYGLPAQDIPVVCNGIDLSRCLKKTDYTLHYPIRLVHVGRFYPQKNHEAILSALVLLKQRGIRAQVSCYGTGPLLEDIRRQAEEMGLQKQVLLEGVTEDVFSALHQGDLFLLPSKWEGLPMTVIEAMGSGMPVVVSNVGGVGDMVTSGQSGLLIEPTAQALADAIETLCKDEALRTRLGTQAMEDAKRFSLEAMASGYEALYRQKEASK